LVAFLHDGFLSYFCLVADSYETIHQSLRNRGQK